MFFPRLTYDIDQSFRKNKFCIYHLMFPTDPKSLACAIKGSMSIAARPKTEKRFLLILGRRQGIWVTIFLT